MCYTITAVRVWEQRNGESIIDANERLALAAWFRRFAERECGTSPLYRTLALAMAGDAELLGVAATARHGPVPNLMLAAVHDQLLQGHGQELATYYQTVVGDAAMPPNDAPPVFRAFVLAHTAALEPALSSRLVQTNEVRRAAVLNLALRQLHAQHATPGLALIEVGASAGLLLATDRYGYHIGTDAFAAPEEDAFVIELERRGERAIPGGPLPEIVERIGLDLVTLDLNDEADSRWLRALIWGDQPERMRRLASAIETASTAPLRMIEGDANEVLPGLLEALPARLPAAVFHSHVLNQFTPEARDRFDEILRAASRERAVYRISMEGAAPEPHPLCKLMVYRAGDMAESTVIARYDAHGSWVEWLAAP